MTARRKSDALIRAYDFNKKDARDVEMALRLQARAWRLLAVIAIGEPEYAKNQAQWLMFNTVPFVNGEVVTRFIEEHEERAVEVGKKVGVFAQ